MTSKPAPSPLPRIATLLSAEQVVERLRTASKRGRLPGFQAGNGALFSVAAHGYPFDGVLRGDMRDGHLEFSLEMLKKLPIIFAIVILLTIWPGSYFMDELVAQVLPSLWRPWITYYWYIPVTVLPIPWMWRGLMRKSRTTMDAAAREAIRKIAGEVEGTFEESTAGAPSGMGVFNVG
jgi:hypothetical protein